MTILLLQANNTNQIKYILIVTCLFLLKLKCIFFFSKKAAAENKFVTILCTNQLVLLLNLNQAVDLNKFVL